MVFNISQKDDYIVYRFEDNSLAVAAEIPSKNVKPNSWNIVSSIKISKLEKPCVFVIVKSSERLTPFSNLGNGIEGATIHKDENIRLELVKFPLPNDPFTP